MSMSIRMLRVLSLPAAVGLALACGGISDLPSSGTDRTAEGRTPTAAAPPAATATRVVRVIDPVLGQVAYTMNVPPDWTFDGTILRTHWGANLVFRTSSVDGLTGLQQLPMYTTIDTANPEMQRFYDNQGTPRMPAVSPDELLRKLVLPHARPDATVGESEPSGLVDGLHAADRAANAQFEQEAARTGTSPKHQVTDASIVHVAYRIAGHPVDERVTAIVTVTDLPDPRGASKLSQATIIAARAPAGQVDAARPQVQALFASIVRDQAWVNADTAFQAHQAADVQGQILARAEHYRLQNKRIFEDSMNRTAIMERNRHDGAMNTVNAIRDEQPMIDPATGTAVTVSDQFNYSYVDENGAVVQTNSAAFNPNAQLPGNWVQLQPMPPK